MVICIYITSVCRGQHYLILSLYMWCKSRIYRLHNLQLDPIFEGLDGTSMEAPRFGFTEAQTN